MTAQVVAITKIMLHGRIENVSNNILLSFPAAIMQR